ncbi:MAG: HAMP domain-containing histidine kinase [Deltaproteobacteria bacterium]|nr:HAMP domain-containing histidine kinase [Deltaproteobacteria bacterium]MCW5802518.1 HAMP domain-containing histidine kinase [Deltaproteobacteria bacterium]
MPAALEPAVTLPWLVRLRWLFVVGLMVLFPVAERVFAVDIDRWWFGVAVAIAAASNVALASRASRRWSPAAVIGAVLIFDTALLTFTLAGHGGATNPFTVFYLVYITFSAVALSSRWTATIASLAVVGFGGLFLVPARTHIHHDGPPLFNSHLQGMWLAFVVAAILTAFFVGKITQAIGRQRDQIAALREAAVRNARLASLATLAAGAAHELNSPLSTIAVAAHEARRAAAEAGATRVADDLVLILEQVDRCQSILHQMAARVSDNDAPEPLTVDDIVGRVRRELGDRGERLDVRTALDGVALDVPAIPLVKSLVALVKNALDASPADARVALAFERGPAAVAIVVEDRGEGIPDDVLGKVGEPFFTTKEPGRGMGLGVFLARVFAESRGGALTIESRSGEGTRARIRLPLAVAA